MTMESERRLSDIMIELADPQILQDESLVYLKNRAVGHPEDELARVLFAYAAQWHTLLPEDVAFSQQALRPLLESSEWAGVAAMLLIDLERWEPTAHFDAEAMHRLAMAAEPTWTTPFVYFATHLIEAGRMPEADEAFAQARSNLMAAADIASLSADDVAFEELFTGRLGRVDDPRHSTIRDEILRSRGV